MIKSETQNSRDKNHHVILTVEMYISYLVLDIAPMAVEHCCQTQICVVPKQTSPNWHCSLQGWRHKVDDHGAETVSATEVGCTSPK